MRTLLVLILFLAATTNGCSENTQKNRIRPDGYELLMVAVDEIQGAYSNVQRSDRLSVFQRTRSGEQGECLLEGAIAAGNSFKDIDFSSMIIVGIFVPEDKKQEISDAMNEHGITLTVTERSKE